MRSCFRSIHVKGQVPLQVRRQQQMWECLALRLEREAVLAAHRDIAADITQEPLLPDHAARLPADPCLQRAGRLRATMSGGQTRTM